MVSVAKVMKILVQLFFDGTEKCDLTLPNKACLNYQLKKWAEKPV